MSTKKIILAVGSALAISSVAQFAMANSGKIDFEGGISATTCDVNIAGKGPNATITLPTVSANLLKKSGDVAGQTRIPFKLLNCTVAQNPTYAKVFFTAANANVNPAGRLDIDGTVTGPASGVDLQILGSDHKAIDLTQDILGQSNTRSQITGAAGAGTADIEYFVQYYATTASAAGRVKSSVSYEIHYE
ncbi:MAG: fimbrial protein [Pseudomonas sp.]